MSNMYGTQVRHEAPGGFWGRVRVTVNWPAWTEINYRDGTFGGAGGGTPPRFSASPLLPATLAAAANERGELKRVDIRLVSGTSVDIAAEGFPGPGNRYNSADSNARVLRTDFRNRHGVWRQWGRTDGEVDLEFEFWFDVPEEADA